jgi:enoyl-CoA hydratase
MAIGGGLDLALACDIRLAAATAVFSLPEASLGTGANFASVLLPELIGRAAAFEMFYTGEKMSADWAWRCGLINRLVEPTELRAQADAFLAELATKSPVSLQRFKATANKSVGLPLSAGLRLNVHPNPYTHPSRLEGLRARREGRAPNW